VSSADWVRNAGSTWSCPEVKDIRVNREIYWKQKSRVTEVRLEGEIWKMT